MKALNWIFAAIGAVTAALVGAIDRVLPARQEGKSLSQRLAESVTQSAALASDCCSDYGTAFVRLSTIR